MKKKVDHHTALQVKKLFYQALHERVFPGAAMQVKSMGIGDNIELTKYYGCIDYDSQRSAVNINTIYDLASLTKPLATTLSILVLLESCQLQLTDRLGTFFNELKRERLGEVTILQLLSHSSGLPGYKPYFINYMPQPTKETKLRLINSILRTRQIYPPGTKCLYSDLGFILLGEIIERVSGDSLDIFFTKQISDPLGLSQDIFFRPLKKIRNDTNELLHYAPTEYCRWRGKMLRGIVHDEHCYLFGGVSGHAGLFGTVKGVSHLCSAILKHWRGEKQFSSISIELMGKCLRKVYVHQGWCMGFDTPSLQGSSSGKYLSGESVGHLGFTGTSVWLDKAKGLSVVLLTNRVHPTRYNTKIRAFRPLFHNTVIEQINEMKKVG